MQKVYQKLTRKHERKQEQRGGGGRGGPTGGYGPPPAANGGGAYAYSRSRSETAVNGGASNGAFYGHRSGSQLRNGFSSGGSQQQLRRETELHERSRSRGGEFRNGFAAPQGPQGAVSEQHRFYDAATGAHGFSESSSWEQREHFERKKQSGARRGLAREGSAALARDGSRSRMLETTSHSNGLSIERVNAHKLG